MLKFVLAICLFGILAESIQGLYLQNYHRSLSICPDERNPGKLVAQEHVTKVLWNGIRVRIPEEGLLENTISCVLVTDQGSSGSTPVITQGGVGSNYVEILIAADLISGLNYNIEVYVNEPTTSSAATTLSTPGK
ncbi:unnamed protein product [Phyllotreta striolata]|uniref:Uncharacterized protein n=1 Tax=Phyllotreta striolata TaxID=444603 RepID=A0A9N9TQ77_PHYSR|nr:unnamed protein product [Phyllotreta striolata]